MRAAGAPRGKPGAGETSAGGSLAQRAERLFPGGSSRTTLYVAPGPARYAAHGEGWRLIDVDGHELIDLHCNYTALVHGHAYPPVLAAAKAALERGASFGLPTAAEVELAECLARRIPWAQRWRFAGSGGEAVMAAVRAARAASGREKVIRFEGCYHGAWDALSQTGVRGVPASAGADVIDLPYGDGVALKATLGAHEGEVACVLLDLMPNRAGLHPAELQFVALVREQTAARSIALILDEVITLRMASGGMQQLYGIEGDIVTLGKLIGGGLPVGALGGRPEWMDVFDPQREDAIAAAGTFSANPVSMSAGLEAVRALDPVQIERIGALGERLRRGLAALGFVVTGAGSLCKLHSEEPSSLWQRLYRQGVLIGGDGLMAVCTPMDEATIDRALEAFERAASDS